MPGALIFLLSALKKIKLNLGIEKDMASESRREIVTENNSVGFT